LCSNLHFPYRYLHRRTTSVLLCGRSRINNQLPSKFEYHFWRYVPYWLLSVPRDMTYSVFITCLYINLSFYFVNQYMSTLKTHRDTNDAEFMLLQMSHVTGPGYP